MSESGDDTDSDVLVEDATGAALTFRTALRAITG